MAQSTRFTLIGLALVLVLIAAATAILLVIAKGSVRQSKIAQCASQMSDGTPT